MPGYKVIYSKRALADLVSIYDYIASVSPSSATRMIERLLDMADSLEEFPGRFGLAREAGRFGFELRQVIVRPYRIVYRVEGTAVRIETFRHASRQPLRPDE